MVLYLYKSAFGNFDFGYAAAVGVVLFVLIFGLTLDPATAVRAGTVVVDRVDPPSPGPLAPSPAALIDEAADRAPSWQPPAGQPGRGTHGHAGSPTSS